MWNEGLDEAQAQARFKIAGRNINNLRYVDDTTLMAESEELKSLLMKVKEESEKDGLKLNVKKTKIMASDPISSVQSLSHVWLCFHCLPIYFPWSGGTGCHDLRFLNVEL